MRILLGVCACTLLFISVLIHAQTGSAGSTNPGSASSIANDSRIQLQPGGIEILSDTQGVDFNYWLKSWQMETQQAWKPLIPKEVERPVLKSGAVMILFKVLPSGRIMDGSMELEGRSGDVALDRAAWGALVASNYQPLPSEFHGLYLKLRAHFLYNMKSIPLTGDASAKSDSPAPATASEQQNSHSFGIVRVPPNPDSDGIYSPGPDLPAPIAIQRVAAVYPQDVPADTNETESILSVVIGSDGIPTKIQVVHTGGAVFDEATINAVKQSTFAPGTLAGKPVPVHIFIRTRFYSDKRIAYPRILNHYESNGDLSPTSGVNGLPSRWMAPEGYDKPPVPIYIHSVTLSDQAIAEKFQGTVLVSALVAEDGLPSDIRVEKSIGHGLDEKAVEAVGKYRFKPAMKDGKPVAVRIFIEVNFKLY